jgi:hypothetical protein
VYRTVAIDAVTAQWHYRQNDAGEESYRAMTYLCNTQILDGRNLVPYMPQTHELISMVLFFQSVVSVLFRFWYVTHLGDLARAPWAGLCRRGSSGWVRRSIAWWRCWRWKCFYRAIMRILIIRPIMLGQVSILERTRVYDEGEARLGGKRSIRAASTPRTVEVTCQSHSDLWRHQSIQNLAQLQIQEKCIFTLNRSLK